MKNAILATTSITALLGLSSCSVFEKTSFDIHDGKSQILEADKRVVLIKNNNGPFPEPGHPDPRQLLEQKPGQSSKHSKYLGSFADPLVCGEPSPDAIMAAAFSARLSADVAGQGGGSAGGGYAESAASIAARTAAVQVLRDIQYRACEALMNGVVGPVHYKQILAAAAYTTIGLVAVDGLGHAEMARPASISPQAPPTGDQRPNGAGASTYPAAAPGASPQPPNSAGPDAQRADTPGEMARALCLTTIASPAGVNARLIAEQQIENGNNGDDAGPKYENTAELTKICMTGIAPEAEKKEKEPTSPPSGPSEVVARK